MALTGLPENYWNNLSISSEDIDFIYNILLERALPLSSKVLTDEIIGNRIRRELKLLEESQLKNGNIYYPKEIHQVGDRLVFPASGDIAGEVSSIRDGYNPDQGEFKVIDVLLDDGKKKAFASQVQDHPLNNMTIVPEDDPNLDADTVSKEYGKILQEKIIGALQQNDDLVRISGNWFPRSLLINVNTGHLNLAEAVMEEMGGGPVTTAHLMNQIELREDAEQKLIEFSLDLALQEDDRFDEVGPAGETLWFLREMEPDCIKETPVFLRYSAPEYEIKNIDDYLVMFEDNLFDELEDWDSSNDSEESFIISLTYPHWRSGTLPLSASLRFLFPTAYEAPRIKFTFIDAEDHKPFAGWVARPGKYIYGLEQWYKKNELMPGSLVRVSKGKNPGEIIVSSEKSRQNKEWLKTVLVGTDRGIVFAVLKHTISASFNERMAVAVPDVDAIDEIWKKNVYGKESYEKTVLRIMRELSKLNPQNQVHALELYASINIVRRCPPSVMLHTLIHNENISHLGDLYFTLKDNE